MSNAVSNFASTVFDTFVKNSLPSSIVCADAKRQELIKLTVTKVHALYVDNNKGIYDDTVEIDFYNNSLPLIKRRGDETTTNETRWCILSPADFYASKLLSCSLSSMTPTDQILPTLISFVHDITIAISNSEDINLTVPGANTGNIALLEGQKLISALTFDNTNNTWQQVDIIKAWLSYYRPPIIPSFGGADNIDILEKDFALAVNYIQQFLQGNNLPFYVKEEIDRKEKEIKYG